ncbi:MAG TPA: hypothetical protein VJP80_07635 [Candidatus Saccharimonadales bacterium]|nr:hypothetical protein [Candidatus Saccharimonadales bacterium]
MGDFGPILRQDIDTYRTVRDGYREQMRLEREQLATEVQELLTDAPQLVGVLERADVAPNVIIEGFGAWRLAKHAYQRIVDRRACPNPAHTQCVDTYKTIETLGTEELLLCKQGLCVLRHSNYFDGEIDNDTPTEIPRTSLLEDVQPITLGNTQGWHPATIRESMLALLIRCKFVK